MAGILINILPRTEYDFKASGANQITVVVNRMLEVVHYQTMRVILRVHKTTVSAAGVGNIVLGAYEIDPADDDPGLDFINGTPAASAGLTVTINSPPLVGFASASGPFAPYLRFAISATQSSQNSPFTAALSADVVLRE